MRNVSRPLSWSAAIGSTGRRKLHGKDDADPPRLRRKVALHHKKLPEGGNVKTQFISILLNRSGYTAFVLNGNGDRDVHDNDQHTYISDFAPGPSDPDGDA
jgi:hypothetical protein